MENSTSNRFIRWVYLASMTIAVFTGFTQMPIARRYYITDLPGLDWVGSVYTNLQVHYFISIIVLAITAYWIAGYVLEHRLGYRLTKTGVLRSFLLAVVLASGFALMLSNLASINLSHPILMVATLSHLGATMVFLLVSTACLISKAKWLEHQPGK